jgi:hypothetical protein
MDASLMEMREADPTPLLGMVDGVPVAQDGDARAAVASRA